MSYTASAPIAADLRDAFSIDRLFAAAHAAIANAKRRRQYRQLLKCDNHTLRDIGVSRDDIRQALRVAGGRI